MDTTQQNEANAFFDKRTPWSKVKHEVLSRYLDVYVSKVGSYEDHLFFVDGFAGCGIYDDGNVGSPLIAAMKSSRPLTHTSAGKLRCIFVEEDTSNAAALEKALMDNFPNVQTTILPGKFDAVLPDILKQIGKAPTFFFIDPFGFQSIDLELLRKIKANTSCKSEVLLRFDDIYLKRMGSFAATHSQNVHAPSVKKAAQTFAIKCSAVLGVDWSNASDSCREDIVASYCDLIKQEGLYKFAISYPVKNPETGGHHYYLVHFCNFEDGYIHMADFMGQIERSIEHKNPELFPTLDQEPSFGVIVDAAVREQDKAVEKQNIDQILAFFRSQPGTRWRKMHLLKRRHFCAAAVDQFGYRIRLKEAQRALTAWLTETGGQSNGTKESSPVTLR